MGVNTDLINAFTLIDACESGDLYRVKALHKQGADIHACGNWPLRFAAQRGHLNIVKYLVEQGASIHVRGDYALRWAALNEHLDIVNYLREVAGARFKCHECLIKSTCLELCKDFRAGEK